MYSIPTFTLLPSIHISYHYIEVTVHHNRAPASEVDVLLPPVTYLETITHYYIIELHFH